MRLTVVNARLIGIGLIGIVFVYSLRPPSGFGDVFSAAARGQTFYLKEPIYYLGLLFFGALTLIGIVKSVRATK